MSKKSKTSSGPPKWAKPYITQGINEVSSVYNANQPQTQAIADSVQGLIPGLVSKFQTGDPNTNAARGYNADVLSGKYLTGNPFLQQMIDASNEDITSSVGGSFGSRGAFGGTAHLQALAREKLKAENALRYNDYNTQMSRMDAAAAQAPSYGVADNASLQALLQAAQTGAQLPYTGINNYSSNIASLIGNSGTTKSSDGGAGIGSALTSAAMMLALSDEDAKVDIRKVGEMADGLGIYSYRYEGDNEPRIGVLAQEVEKFRPWASGPRLGGYRTVNYGAL